MAHGGGSRWRCAFIRLRERVEMPDTQESHRDVYLGLAVRVSAAASVGAFFRPAQASKERVLFIRDENEQFPAALRSRRDCSVEFCGARAETERFTILRARPPDPERATEA